MRDRVGDYKLKRPLGSDPSGTVYWAKDTRSGALVTVKELATELVADAGFLERFRHESGLLTRLFHPNCGNVLDLLEIDGRAYLVSEPIQGRTLREVIASSNVRPGQALALLRGSLVGLDAAHSAGVLHRWLRPECVVVQPNGLVRVTGFGQPAYGTGAAAQAALPPPQSISPYAYIAPEQVVGAEADARTDVYLAGVLGFELLSGQPPFTSREPAEVWSMHMAQNPPMLTELRPEVSVTVAHMLNRALAKVPDNRQQSAREFIGQIDAVSAPLGVEWTEATVVGGLRPVGPRHHTVPATVGNPQRGAVNVGGKLGWQARRVLIPGVAALALTLSAVVYGYNPSWLGIRGGAGQISASTAQAAKPGLLVHGAQPPGAPPDLLLLPTPAPGLSAARVALPAVHVSPLLLSAVQPTALGSPAAPPTLQPSPPGTVPPSPPSPPSPKPRPPSPCPSPKSDDDSDRPSADADREKPDAEDRAEARDRGCVADADDARQGDRD